MQDKKNNNLQKAKNKRTMYIFFATFFFSMFLVGFIIKTLSPNVDVEIGDDVDTTQSETPENSAGGNVDNRLKWIQFEDNMPGVSKRLPSEETVPMTQNENDSKRLEKLNGVSSELDEQNLSQQQQVTKNQKNTPPTPTSSEVARSARSTVAVPKISKVYVGYYTSVDQAITVQNKLIDSDLNVSPFVKEVNGYYVVQVGSFANRQKAQSLYGDVSAMGLPAKIVSE